MYSARTKRERVARSGWSENNEGKQHDERSAFAISYPRDLRSNARETYYDISENAFRIKSDRSCDGGKTWQPGIYAIEAVRLP